MLLEHGEGGVEVGGLGEAPLGSGAVGVAARELGLAAAVDPVQQPAGVVDAGVGAHEVEYRPGVVDQVGGQLDCTGEDVAGDRPVPAVAEVAGQVQETGEAAGGSGELGCPAGQVGEVAAVGGQPGR